MRAQILFSFSCVFRKSHQAPLSSQQLSSAAKRRALPCGALLCVAVPCYAFDFVRVRYHAKVAGARLCTYIGSQQKNCAVPGRPVLCFLFRTNQVSFESTRYQGMYVPTITQKSTPAQLSLASSAAPRSAVRFRTLSCGAVLCLAVPCCARL